MITMLRIPAGDRRLVAHFLQARDKVVPSLAFTKDVTADKHQALEEKKVANVAKGLLQAPTTLEARLSTGGSRM